MNNKESNFLSVVVYLQKEEKQAYEFLEMLDKVLNANFQKYEIICVDDAAGDNVQKDILKYKEKNVQTSISIIKMGFQQGVEASMNAGVDLSIGDFVLEFDSCYVDYESTLILDIYRKALEGFDIVTALPPQKQSKITSRLFYMVYNHFSNSNYRLATNRFQIISRRAINRVSAYSKTIPFRKAVYASSGLKICGLDYIPTKQNALGTKFDDIARSNTAVDSLVLFTNVAYKVSLFISGVMAIFMIAVGLYVIITYLGVKKPVEGWTAIMGLISIGFFAIFLILTIAIKYLEVLVKLVFKSQKYQVLSIDKL